MTGLEFQVVAASYAPAGSAAFGIEARGPIGTNVAPVQTPLHSGVLPAAFGPNVALSQVGGHCFRSTLGDTRSPIADMFILPRSGSWGFGAGAFTEGLEKFVLVGDGSIVQAVAIRYISGVLIILCVKFTAGGQGGPGSGPKGLSVLFSSDNGVTWESGWVNLANSASTPIYTDRWIIPVRYSSYGLVASGPSLTSLSVDFSSPLQLSSSPPVVAHNGSGVVVVSVPGTSQVFVSTANGQPGSWTPVVVTYPWGGTDGSLDAISYGNGVFVAVGYRRASPTITFVAYSPDGVSWQFTDVQNIPQEQGNPDYRQQALASTGSVFARSIATTNHPSANRPHIIYTSTDGVAWTNRGSLSSYARLGLAAAANGRLYASAKGVSSVTIYDGGVDGQSWTSLFATPSAYGTNALEVATATPPRDRIIQVKSGDGAWRDSIREDGYIYTRYVFQSFPIQAEVGDNKAMLPREWEATTALSRDGTSWDEIGGAADIYLPRQDAWYSRSGVLRSRNGSVSVGFPSGVAYNRSFIIGRGGSLYCFATGIGGTTGIYQSDDANTWTLTLGSDPSKYAGKSLTQSGVLWSFSYAKDIDLYCLHYYSSNQNVVMVTADLTLGFTEVSTFDSRYEVPTYRAIMADGCFYRASQSWTASSWGFEFSTDGSTWVTSQIIGGSVVPSSASYRIRCGVPFVPLSGGWHIGQIRVGPDTGGW